MAESIKLPKPSLKGTRSLEEVLVLRRSNRHFRDWAVELSEISQLLWAGQGQRDSAGYRMAPSAGQRYPLDVYVLRAGELYHYLPEGHQLESIGAADVREALYRAAHNQEAIREAPLTLIITAEFPRAEHQYGEERAVRFAHMEAGHVAQNILLQAYASGLAGVAFGAFVDEKVSELLPIPEAHQPLYILALGHGY